MEPKVITYGAYILISIFLTVWVARTLHKYGRVFLVDAFLGKETLADSVNHLLVVDRIWTRRIDGDHPGVGARRARRAGRAGAGHGRGERAAGQLDDLQRPHHPAPVAGLHA